MHLVQSRAPHVVILGGGYAGMMAALRLARASSGNVTLINAAPHFVERIRLHQIAAGQKLLQRPLDALLRGTGTRLLVGRITAIDTAAQRVAVEQPDGSRLDVAWDYLVYALGSGPGAQVLPGGREHLHTVAHEAGAQRTAATLSKLSPGASVAVVGGGLTGIETACELAESYPQLRLSLLSNTEVAPGLSLRGRAYVKDCLRSLGVEIREGASVLAAERDALTLRDGTLPIAAAVLCAGFAPSTLAAASGLPQNASGQLCVDTELRVPAHPRIFGCGDGVGFGDSMRALRMACATAMPMAAHAADNLSALLRDKPLRPFGFSFFAQCISLGRRRGIVQRVDENDAPRSFIVTDRMGARLKEAVCRFTVLSLAVERTLAGTYTWPGRRRSLAVEPAPNLVS